MTTQSLHQIVAPTQLMSQIGQGNQDRSEPAKSAWDASWERVSWSCWRRYANLARDSKQDPEEEGPTRRELRRLDGSDGPR